MGNAEDGSSSAGGDILRRARSRLLEDLDVTSSKGGHNLPHSLAKYKGVSFFVSLFVCFEYSMYLVRCSHFMYMLIDVHSSS